MSTIIMAGNRWNHLDFEPRRRNAEAGAADRRAPRESPEANDTTPDRPRHGQWPGVPSPSAVSAAESLDVLPPVVVQAWGAYLLGNFPAVLDLLEPRLREQPDLAGGQRVLAGALARLNREEEAIEHLREAVCRAPQDWLARASLASLLLRAEDGIAALGPKVSPASDAAAHLEAAMATASEASRPVVQELLGAARWREGQTALARGACREAGRLFAAAGRGFERAAARSGAARLELPARQAAAFVGQAVALLLAGEAEAAQRLFSRTAFSVTAAQPLVRFAAGLYELCEELAGVPPDERAGVATALPEVVLATRLEVGFYDGRRGVSLFWRGGVP
jgi:tetratricopeptide (TPR) repeat protein